MAVKAQKPIKRLAFVINKEKAGAESLGEKLKEQAERMGVKCKVSSKYPVSKGFLDKQDACCAIGGDGTLLSVVAECMRSGVPVFGINQGKLGFLATFSVIEAKKHFDKILEGKYKIRERYMLRCRTSTGKEAYALNDVVIKSSQPSRLMEMEVYSNNEYVTSYSGDGLIIATATGSTAYNLSAGGPIIYPGASVFAMTPICAHTLTNRTVVFDRVNEIKIDLPEGEEDVLHGIVSMDGQMPWKVGRYFPIHIKMAPKTLKLLHPLNYSHFRILRNKLKWGD